MKNLFLVINNKINGIVWTLISTGIFILMLGVLIVWTNFLLRLLVGLIVIVVAYVFFYFAYRILLFKKEIKKIIKRK